MNGTLGTIIGFGDEEDGIIYVRTEDGRDFDVEREIWSNVRYTFNEKEQKIEEEEIGSGPLLYTKVKDLPLTTSR